jgi:hypothetical protein
MNERIDLKVVGDELGQKITAIQSLWIFGSRRFGTRSVRSDIDLLACFSEHVRPGDLRNAIRTLCPALDMFVVEGGKATSCMNESFVQAESFERLRDKLGALCVWSRNPSEIDTSAPHEHEVRVGIDHIPTVLDGGEPRLNWGRSVKDYFRDIEADGVPTEPFIGDDVEKVARFLLGLIENLVNTIERMSAKTTRASWNPTLTSEYDLQQSFYLTVKAWLPDLAREEVTIRYDDQDKRSDFSLLQSRIVIEMKHVTDASTKASVVKTLRGLADFYRQHPNVKVLLFIVTAKRSADVDAARWANEFSSSKNGQSVITRVYHVQ